MRSMRYAAAAMFTGLVLLPCFCLAASSAAPAPVAHSAARGVVEQAMRDVLAILRNPSLSPTEKRHKVRDIAYERMDFETLSRLSMGRNWRDLPPAQQGDFILEFKTHMSATYGHSIDRYAGEEINVTGDRKETNGDWTVQTTLGKPGGGSQEAIKLDYRLRQKDNQWKVIDVTIDGVSMVANFRSQFQDIMANGGVERLLKLLREKNAAAEQ